MSHRIMIVVFAFILAYAAVYLGDGYFQMWMAAPAVNVTEKVVLLGFLSAIIAVIGIAFWGLFMRFTVNNGSDTVNDEEALWIAAIPLVLVSYAFGAIAGPFTQFGAAPWSWASRWVFFELAAFVPMALAINGTIVYAMSEKKTSVDNVTPINRDRSTG